MGSEGRACSFPFGASHGKSKSWDQKEWNAFSAIFKSQVCTSELPCNGKVIITEMSVCIPYFKCPLEPLLSSAPNKEEWVEISAILTQHLKYIILCYKPT